MRLVYCIVIALLASYSFAGADESRHWYWVSGVTGCGKNNTASSSWCGSCSQLNACAGLNSQSVFACNGDGSCRVNGSPYPMTKRQEHCDIGETFDESVGSCQPPCPTCYKSDGAGSCVDKCDSPQVCNYDTNSCSDPQECPEGQIPLSIIGTGEFTCIPDFEYEPDECSNVAGYVSDSDGNEYQVCNDDKDKCEATGGTYGFVGVGSDATQTCLPPDYGDDVPTCAAGSIVVHEGDGNGFACTPVDPKDDPNQEDNPDDTEDEKDTDGDGVPDSRDDDIDGDGVPNGSDPDVDGDGVANGDDLTPNGESPSKVTGGRSCGSRPRCSGDAIQCSMLYQLWSVRCEKKEGSAQASDSCEAPPTCEGDPISCAVLKQQWHTGCNSPFEDQATLDGLTAEYGVETVFSDDVDMTDDLTGIFSSPASASACPADKVFNYGGEAIAIPLTPFCDLAAAIRPLFLILCSLIGIRYIWSAF